MKNIYLFCNIDYGLPFLERMGSFASRNKDFRFVIVMSEVGLWGEKPWRRLLDRINTYLLVHGISRIRRVLFVSNINAEKFVNKVPLGSIGFVAGFNQIFHDALISRFSELNNFHPSVLPHYRGAIPSYWVLLNRELVSGFTMHELTRKIDSGPILHQQSVDVPAGCNEKELDFLIAHAASSFLEVYLEAKTSGIDLPRTVIESPYRVPAGYMPANRVDQDDSPGE